MKSGGNILKGKRIIITRSASGSALWKKYFIARGAVVYCFPTIEKNTVQLNKKIISTLRELERFDRVVITSIEALRALHSLVEKSGIDVPPKRFPPLAVTGTETARAARAMGYRVDFQPSIANATALAWELPLKGYASGVLFLRSTIASRKIHEILTARGAKVVDRPVYRTVSIKKPDLDFSKLLDGGLIDYFTFASPSAVRGFFVRLDKKFHKKALAIPVVAIGPKVLKTLKKAGFKTIRVAAEPTPKGMAEAVI